MCIRAFVFFCLLIPIQIRAGTIVFTDAQYPPLNADTEIVWLEGSCSLHDLCSGRYAPMFDTSLPESTPAYCRTHSATIYSYLKVPSDNNGQYSLTSNSGFQRSMRVLYSAHNDTLCRLLKFFQCRCGFLENLIGKTTFADCTCHNKGTNQ